MPLNCVCMCRLLIFPNLPCTKTHLSHNVFQLKLMHATRDFVIQNGGSKADLILQMLFNTKWKRLSIAVDGGVGVKIRRLHAFCKMKLRWTKTERTIMLIHWKILNQWKCFFFKNCIAALQSQDSALTGYWWCLSEFWKSHKPVVFNMFDPNWQLAKTPRWIMRVTSQYWNLVVKTDPRLAPGDSCGSCNEWSA